MSPLASLGAGLLAFAVLGAAGCASFQPEPCTAEWVEWRKDRAYAAYKREHRREIDVLRELSRTLGAGEGADLTLGEIARVTPAVLTLASGFVEVTVPEIQTALAQCGSPPRAAQLFADLLRGEGVDERTVRGVERFAPMLDGER